MADADRTHLATFAPWLVSLGEDARELARCLDNPTVPAQVRILVAGGLNYVLKSLDLIPDGAQDIGLLDDAFVLRVAAWLATNTPGSWTDAEFGTLVARLAGDAGSIRAFLGPLYPRLVEYTRTLGKSMARGRPIADLVVNDETRRAFVADLNAWASGYEAAPSLDDPAVLLKLRSFLETRLAAAPGAS
jgi:uncharacterized membrane protein YkvA (DUF1232 family)